MLSFSVLMTVYKSEDPIFLDGAIKSIWTNQELKPNQIIIVKDGPIKNSLEKVLDKWEKNIPDVFEVYSLKKNLGLGEALNFGIKHCKYDYIARMDTDDISLPGRFKDQINYLNDNKDIDIIGSYVFECGENENDITGIRKVPISNKEIYEISKYRNPFNHPSVVYKKNKVIEVGGPKKFTDFDDYYLWLRMLKNKAKCINLDYPLLIMRAGASQAQRRGGLDYIYNEINLFYFAYKIHHINFLTFIFNIILRVPVRLLPYKLRYSLYKLLRKR